MMIWTCLDSCSILHPYRSLHFIGLQETWREVDKLIKVILDSRISSQVKMDLGVLWWNFREVVVLKRESIHVLLIWRGTMGNVYWVPRVLLAVLNMGTKWEIFLLEMISKSLLMFQKMMLQRRGISRHSRLEEHNQKRLMMMMVSSCYSLFSYMSTAYVGE